MPLRYASIALAAAGLALAAPAQIKPQPTLASVPIPLRGGDGSSTFTLTNSGPNTLALALTAGPVVDTATHAVLSRAKATLTPLTGPPEAPAPIAPDQPPAASATSSKAITASIPPSETLSYQIDIKGVSGASAAEVELFNGTTKLGSLDIMAADAPLAIAIDGDGSSTDRPLAYAFDTPVMLALKNNDTLPYSVHWAFQVDGDTMTESNLNIPASGTARIPVKSPCDQGTKIKRAFLRLFFIGSAHEDPCDVYKFFDRVHPSAKQGLLFLTVIGPDQVTPGLLPARTLPINLAMHRVSLAWSNFYAYVYAAFFLLLGGFFSYLASSVLPAMQRRSDLRAQLQELVNRITSISNRIDSHLRVVLWLELNRSVEALNNSSAWIPAANDPIPLVTASIDTLRKRLSAAESLDDLRRKHDQISATAPPSVTDSIDASLQSAAEQLHSLALSDADLTAATGFLVKAQALLAMLDDFPTLAKQISGNVTALETRLAKFPPNYYADLKAALPGVFVIVEAKRGYDNPKNIVRPMLFAIDHGVAAIQLALDYAMVRASVPSKPPPDTKAATDPAVNPESGNHAPGTDPALNAAAVRDTAAAAQTSAIAAQTTAAALGTPSDVPPDAPPFVPLPDDAPPLALAISASLCDDLGEKIRQRLLKRQGKLVELLGTLSWRALREANLLVQEMREDAYEEDILDEMENPGQAVITSDTQIALPYLPVFFVVAFKNSRFNGAAALQRLICHWTFPGKLEETCWNVCHYFDGSMGSTPVQSRFPWLSSFFRRLSCFFRPPAPPRTVTLTIRAAVRGQEIQKDRKAPAPLESNINFKHIEVHESSRTSADLIRFLIAFAVALAGLFSGALDQLNKLDFISATVAIVALGFGANSVKNLLTQSAPPAPAARGASRT